MIWISDDTFPDNFLHSMVPWFQVILNTAARVMHCAFPVTNNTNFFLPGPSENADQKSMRHLLWYWGATYSTSLVFVYRTPFILNEREMQDFVQCYSVGLRMNNQIDNFSLWIRISFHLSKGIPKMNTLWTNIAYGQRYGCRTRS